MFSNVASIIGAADLFHSYVIIGKSSNKVNFSDISGIVRLQCFLFPSHIAYSSFEYFKLKTTVDHLTSFTSSFFFLTFFLSVSV